MPQGRYELLEHTADLAVRVRGADLAELLANLAWAVTDVMADAKAVALRESRALCVRADSEEELLVAWANEILFHFESERLLLPVIEELTVAGLEARGRARGERLDPARHGFKTELKSATYHGLAVRRDEAGIGADLVIDV
jgi:SHS2 domain-containing protein